MCRIFFTFGFVPQTAVRKTNDTLSSIIIFIMTELSAQNVLMLQLLKDQTAGQLRGFKEEIRIRQVATVKREKQADQIGGQFRGWLGVCNIVRNERISE